MKYLALLAFLVGCSGSEPADQPTPTPSPSPSPSPVPQPNPPTPVESGPVELSLRVSNQTGYDIVAFGVEFCVDGECGGQVFGDGTFVVLAAGVSVQEDEVVRDQQGNILEMEYGGTMQVLATAVDVDGDGYCMFGCEYSDYVIDDRIDVFLDFTLADCCWEFGG